jgi:hypothetical protein
MPSSVPMKNHCQIKRNFFMQPFQNTRVTVCRNDLEKQMNTLTRTSLALLALGLATGPSLADAPAPDFNYLPAYITALNHSQDPQAIAIRREIADGPAALAQARTKVQAAGIPLTTTTPTVAPSQNAAPLFDQWKALQTQQQVVLPDYEVTLSNRYTYTSDQIARVQKVVDDNPKVVDLLHEAASKPVRVYTGEVWMHYAQVREAARELKTESYLAAYQGHYADAVTLGGLGLNLAKQDAPQTNLVGYLVDDALEDIALAGLQETLATAGPNAAVDTQVSQTIQDPMPILSLKRALTSEIALGVSELDTARNGTPSDFAELTAPAGVPVPPNAAPKTFTPAERVFVTNLVDATEAAYLTRMQALIADVNTPNQDVAFAAMQKSFNDSSDPMVALDPLHVLLGIVTVFGPLQVVDNKQRADEQVTLAAAAVLDAKARNGAFPTTLAGDFTDPFNGKPLGYRLIGDNGFVVYSVGPDGTFDGNANTQSQYPTRQVFFQYPAPAPQPVPADMLK